LIKDKAEGMAQMVEHLPSRYKALEFKLQYYRKKGKEKRNSNNKKKEDTYSYSSSSKRYPIEYTASCPRSPVRKGCFELITSSLYVTSSSPTMGLCLGAWKKEGPKIK
jgi:hypothetical protein